MDDPQFEKPVQQSLNLDFEDGIATPQPNWKDEQKSLNLRKQSHQPIQNPRKVIEPREKINHGYQNYGDDDAFTETGYNVVKNTDTRNRCVDGKWITEKFSRSKGVWLRVEEQ